MLICHQQWIEHLVFQCKERNKRNICKKADIYKVSKKTHSSSVGGMNCSILNEGLRNISAGTVDYTDGADVIPISRLSATKSEAHKSLVCG